MSTYLLLAIVGLALGSAFAALGAGLVVVYKGSGVINFACGAMAAWGVFVYDEVRRSGDLVFPVVWIPDRVHIGTQTPPFAAAALGVLSCAGLGLVAHFVVFRPLRDASTLARVVASAAVMQFVQVITGMRFGNAVRQVPTLLPRGRVRIGTSSVEVANLWLGGIALGIGVALWVYFRFARTGLATRALSESERNTSFARFSPSRLGAVMWIVSCTVTASVLIFAAPIIGLGSTTYTLFIVPALACALVGRLDAVLATVVAGLTLGVVNSELTFISSRPWFPEWAHNGVTSVVPFLVVMVMLFVFGSKLPVRGERAVATLPAFHIPRNRPRVIVPLVAVGIALITLTSGSYRFGVVMSMAVTIIMLSMVTLTGLVGQVSFAQAAVAGSAGFILSKLSTAYGIGFPWAPLLGALAATALGVLVGVPALRIRGTQLAVVSLSAAVAVEVFVFLNPVMLSANGTKVPPPTIFGIDLGIRDGHETARAVFGYLVLAVLVVCALAVANIARSATGRRFLAVRSNERAAAAAGIDVAGTKITAFALAAFLAGVGGTLIGYSQGALYGGSFGALVGVTWLTSAYLGGITSVSGAFLAGLAAPLGLMFVIADRWIGSASGYVLAGAVGTIVTVIQNPEGIAGAARDNWAGFVARLRPRTAAPAATLVDPSVAPVATPAITPDRQGTAALRVSGLSVRYGGLLALDELDLAVYPGEIVGLIGANGAGKTTFIDAVTGFAPSTGSVELGGRSIESEPPHRRARLGLRRTWQSGEVFSDLSVNGNVRVATEPGTPWTLVLDVVHPTRSGHDAATDSTLARLGILHVKDARPDELPFGTQKLLGVARAFASSPSVVLLDEPAAGLSTSETTALGARLRAALTPDTAMLLVEHDVEMVLGMCDYVYVLDFGRLLAEGRPDEVRHHPEVIAAYIGSAATDSERLS